MKNSPNSFNSNFWVNWAKNLKALFTLPKWLKIFLGALSMVAVVGVVASFVLMSWADDKIENGRLELLGIDKGKQDLQDKFAYDSRLYFERLDVLLRSKTIAYIGIISISWVSQVDENAVSEIKSQNRHIKFTTSQDLLALNTHNLGEVKYKMDFSPLLKTIVRYFALIVVCVGVFWVLWKMFVNLSNSLPPKNATLEPTRTLILTRKDYIFLTFAFLLCAGICAFTFWLGFPGFHNVSDIYINISLEKSNFAPVFISYVLEFLYFLFGKHLYYLFLFNIVPFYLGIFFLIAGFYMHSKNPFVLMLIFCTFIGNFYFENFIQHYSFSLSMLLFCMWALLLFLVLVPLSSNKRQKILSKILWFLLFMLMFFAILWRHNAIFSVFPAFLVIIYIFLKNHHLNSKTFTKHYIALTILSAMLCLAIALFIPKILTTSESYPENHTLLHQIAGACVPSDDKSCFKTEWYKEGKNFESVKAVYLANTTNGDTMLFGDKAPFKTWQKLEGLKTQWAKSVFKHPINFAKHELRFLKGMWIDKSWMWIFSAKEIQDRGHLQKEVQTPKGFPQDEQKVTFSPIQEQIYSFFYDYRIIFPHILGVCVSAFAMIICGWFLLRRKFCNAIVVFAFSTGFAGFWSAFFIACFIPVPVGRYMSPVFAISFIAFISFVVFVLDYLSRKKIKADKG